MNETLPTGLASPPSWSLAVGETGRSFVLIAVALFILAIAFWLCAKSNPLLEKIGKWSFSAACCAVLGAFVALGVLFAANRFEYSYIFNHADTHNALQYRIAGIWSGQEGSFLLWAACSAVFALLTVAKTGLFRRWYTVAYASFLAGITAILAFESPFKLNLIEGKPFVPTDGLGLAPSLQNYWVVIHPPTIFLGFGSLTALFALSLAAMIERDYESWVPIVRPWAIVAMTLVGVGLCMGGFWAYETLGWGGFWMWDPVENVSFVPWCFGIAFVHGIMVQATKKKWQFTNLLLGGLPFLAFVYGTFLTRSGFLSDASVHSFAEMDRSALKLLIGVMGGTTLVFTALWFTRLYQARKAETAVIQEPKGANREAFYMVGIATLVTMGVATLLGMSVPFVQALKGQKPKVVEEALYHQVLVWIFVPLMILMAATPFVTWRGMKMRDLLGKMYSVLCITVGLTGLLLFVTVISPFSKKINMAPTVNMLGKWEVQNMAWPLVLVGICLMVLVGNAWRVTDLFRRSKLGIAPFMAHIGIGLLMTGLIASRAFEKKGQGIVMEDHPGRLLNYEIRYSGMTSDPHDRDNKLKLAVYDPHDKSGKPLFTATPGLYEVEGPNGEKSTMRWPYIQKGWLMDTYVSLGEPQSNASEDMSIPAGESRQFGGLNLTYVKMTRSGEFGMKGTKFGALVKVEGNGANSTINPQMEIGEGGSTISHPAKLDEHMQLAMVGMDAATKSVVLQVQLTTPLYPVEVYHKPLTILVWIGTGLMTLSGFASAYYRKKRRKTVEVEEPVPEARRKRSRAGDLATAIEGKTT